LFPLKFRPYITFVKYNAHLKEYDPLKKEKIHCWNCVPSDGNTVGWGFVKSEHYINYVEPRNVKPNYADLTGIGGCEIEIHYISFL